MLSFGSYLSGMGMMDAGALEAGFTLAFAVEYDPGNVTVSMKIADMHEANLLGCLLLRQDVTTVNPADLPAVHWFHASPVCKEFSNAKSDGEEGAADIQVAEAVAAYIAHHLPPFVTIENVWGYRKSKSWAIIRRKLARCGYAMQVQHVNMADYGVPQTRKRMIVLAARDAHHVTFPHKTHEENPTAVPTLFDIALPKWVGWYEAIEDLIPTLPDSQFAPWQLERLPDNLKNDAFLISGANTIAVMMESANKSGAYALLDDAPAMTVETYRKSSLPRALPLNHNKTEWSDGNRNGDKPAHSVTGEANVRTRALLVDSAGYVDADGRLPVTRDESDPSNVVVANHERRPMRAFLVEGINPNGGSDRHIDEPSQSVTTSHPPRAFVDFWNTGRDATILEDEPSVTIQAWHGRRPSHAPTAFTNGRVVKMTPRALARFQSLPDWYELSGKSSVDVTGIGNGVPSLFAQRLGEHIKNQLEKTS